MLLLLSREGLPIVTQFTQSWSASAKARLALKRRRGRAEQAAAGEVRIWLEQRAQSAPFRGIRGPHSPAFQSHLRELKRRSSLQVPQMCSPVRGTGTTLALRSTPPAYMSRALVGKLVESREENLQRGGFACSATAWKKRKCTIS